MKYDLIASLGANCSVAFELQRRFMRPFSLPFDWLCIDSSRTVEYLSHAFKSGFADFMLKENLIELKQNDPLFVPNANDKHVQYYDRKSGYRFLHHFDGVIARNEIYYTKTHTMMKRRIDRMYEVFSKGDIYLLLATDVPIQNEHLILLDNSLHEVFPNAHFKIRCMQFASKLTASEDSSKEFGRVERFDYRRKMNDYDFFYTNYEWHFLESVSVPYAAKIKHSLTYKIWKHLNKRLGIKNG